MQSQVAPDTRLELRSRQTQNQNLINSKYIPRVLGKSEAEFKEFEPRQ